MSGHNEGFEWELSKENVLPLKSGRDCSTLNAVLQPHNTDQQSKLKAEKHDFELELRTYAGDDPLDVWDRYIRWIEKTFPSRGVGGNFATIVQRCLQQFNDDKRYTNDHRFIVWWIKFANLCDEPLEIFNFMFDKGLGVELSCFYEAWACCLEQAGNYQKADAIFQEGYKRICEPPDRLLVKYQEFQVRVARGNTSQQAEAMDEGEERSVLGDLRPIGKKHQVGTKRTGSSKQASKGGLGLRSMPLKTQNKRHEVLNEENVQPSLVPQQTGEWKNLPSRKQSNIENELQPGPWNKSKLPQRPGFSGAFGQPDFKIHVEDDNALVTPHKTVVDGHVLSARKPKQADPLAPMRNTQSGSGVDQVPAYMKSMIYTGMEEFSFEELRAAKYMKEKREKLKIEEEKQRIEAEKKQLAKMREELGQYHLAIREEMQQERALLIRDVQSQLQTININESVNQSVNQSINHPSQPINHTDSILSQHPPGPKCVPKPKLSSNDSRVMTTPGSSENTREQPVTKQLNFDEMTTGLTENIAQSLQQRHQPDIRAIKPNLNMSHNSSQQTPNLSLNSTTTNSAGSRQRSGVPTPDSEGSFYKKQGLTAPSPTVHTKEAFQVVIGMFNCTLQSEEQFGWSEPKEQMEGIEEAPKTEAPFQVFDEKAAKAGSAPFQIYDEKAVKSDAASFKVFDENAPQIASVPFQIYDESSSENNTPPTNVQPIVADKENIEYEVPLETKLKKRGLSISSASKQPVKSASRKELPTPPMFDNSEKNDFVFEEKMEDHEMDFTMATAGFSATARLASTPYNLSTNVNPLFAPPLSTIKCTDRPNITMEQSQPIEPSNNSQKTNFPQQEQTFDVHMDTPNKLKLSPIMEGSTEGGSSDESKSQASSLASKNYSHRLPSVDESHSLCTSHRNTKINSQRLPSVNQSQQEFQGPQNRNLKFSLSESSVKPHNISTQSAQTNQQIPINNLTQAFKDSHMVTGINDSKHLESESSISDRNHLDSSKTQNTSQRLQKGEDSLPLPPPTMAPATDKHVIDMSCYIPQEPDEKTEALLMTSVLINPTNPFDEETILDILSNLAVPLNKDPCYVDCAYLPVPDMRANNFVDLGGDTYQIKSCIGTGGFAKIFKVSPMLNDYLDITEEITEICTDVVLKVQKPVCRWEFYICKEIEKRLQLLNEPVDIAPSLVTVKKGYFFDNGSCLLQDYYSQGTLLNLVNAIKRNARLMPDLEPFAVYITIEMFHIIEKLHKCQIIHGDIKPDNFLVDTIPDIKVSKNKAEVFGNKTKFLKLIDFGQSIDMAKFPEGTTFLAKVGTSGFKCIEMQTDQPWTYQTDIFGMVGTIHVLIFGKYMNVYQSKGKWHIANSFVRKWNQPLWKELFHTLLNIPSCDELPNLSALRTSFEDYFMSDLVDKYNGLVYKLRNETFMKR
ncbi:hypothetical protein SNE40_019589 [Patella caerulea]|uniref:Mitotic checkpoint serine/threonine-protein kinase BUB1 n=1 Tax=Patella caerulea TaxID=87958 RepID=A0AAN8PJ02_PATCE